MKIITIKEATPLLGAIAFGIIDRGTNLLQVRCTSVCNLNCPFCFTNAGSTSTTHQVEYTVEKDHLVKWIKKVIELKQERDIEINLDSAGEVSTYKDLIALIQDIKKIQEVSFISMQCNGQLLTESFVDQLEEAGLNRINLSIHSLNKEKSKLLMGCSFYDIEKIKRVAKYIAQSKIELEIAPVLMNGINNEDVEELIQFAKEIASKILIQNYLEYKNSRTMKGVKELNWFKFYRLLTEWEKKYSIKLKYGPRDFNLRRTKKLPLLMKKGEKIQARILEIGWLHGEMLASYKERLITIEKSKNKIGDKANIVITKTKDGIYYGKKA